MSVIAPGTSLARTLAELLCEAVSSDDRRWYLWGRPVGDDPVELAPLLRGYRGRPPVDPRASPLR